MVGNAKNAIERHLRESGEKFPTALQDGVPWRSAFRWRSGCGAHENASRFFRGVPRAGRNDLEIALAAGLSKG